MSDRKENLIRLPEVIKRTGISKTTIYELINEKRFPSQVKIGTRAVAFIESEIDEWFVNLINTSRNKLAEKNRG
ncbi:helix-turn-helix transcriptional regulator [Serratia marcescens]|uniref:helix-turn-helix transcriptional regulator n=1 Tax=Serratia marcescens TaxID=615 RepID=UPI000929EA69|nr:AlpA family transcriptional regulator [Serratia marcescens]OJH81918.1 putative regulatory protein [Serratia marcescens]